MGAVILLLLLTLNVLVIMDSNADGKSAFCMIHYAQVQDDELVSPRDADSWATLLNAAKLRGHEELIKASFSINEDGIPELFYHRKCRQLFTMKRDLDKLSKDGSEQAPEKKERRKSMRDTSISSNILPSTCIFCKASKYIKGSKSREPLNQCVEEKSHKSIIAAILKKNDVSLFPLTARDLIASEAKYHRSCYRIYTKTVSKSTDVNEDDIEMNAYQKLIEYVQIHVIEELQVVKLTYLTELAVSFMKNDGVTGTSSSISNHIKRKLQSDFQDELLYTTDDKGKVLVFPKKLSKEDLVRENHQLKRENDILKKESKDATSLITKAGLHLRSIIRKFTWNKSWPFFPDTLVAKAFNFPPLLMNFLSCLLTGDPSTTDLSQRCTWLSNSFAQDLMFAATRGAIIPPKHILLPCVVKALTGNVQLIQALNRLGHGVSYTMMEENETALCLYKLEMSHLPLPSNIRPHVFTTLSWDNIDRLEETLTGGGTCHRVNGIAVLPPVFGPHYEDSKPHLEKTGRRSIDIPEQHLPIYNAGDRKGPHSLHTEEVDFLDDKTLAEQKNFIWMLLRQFDTDAQKIMSWTGFNITVRRNVECKQDNIGYLPTINSPATDLSTVQEILKQSNSIRQELKLETVVIVFDQAIYAKACEIKWKHRAQYEHLILRLGTFHTICNFLSIIGKRFQDAGLKDIFIKSGILAEGSVDSVMEGRQYNRGVYGHKLMFEALLRIAWKGFSSWMRRHNMDMDVTNALLHLDSLHETCDPKAFEEVMEDPVVKSLFEHFKNYMCFLKEKNCSLSQFWMSYVEMVGNVLLGLIRASREGNWKLHLAAIRHMIPWCFAYDKTNYARYLSVYYAEMSNLQTNHPDIYQEFMKGRFAVQNGDSNPFGRIPVDQTTEETVNRDTQTPGGTCRFSLKQGPVSRYYLTSEFRCEYVRLFHNMLGMN